MTCPSWVTREEDALVFKVRLIGFDGGNAVVGVQQGGVYIGLPRNHVVWVDGEPGPGYVGLVRVPHWVAKFHRALTGAA